MNVNSVYIGNSEIFQRIVNSILKKNHSLCTVTVKLILVKCFPLYSALNVWTHFSPWWRHQIEMEAFSALLALCRRSPVNSPHKGQWHGAVIFSLICAWRNGLVNNQDAGDLIHHYVVTVMHTAEGTPWPKLNNKFVCLLYYCYWLMPLYVKTSWRW